jgi:hypothetical protein
MLCCRWLCLLGLLLAGRLAGQEEVVWFRTHPEGPLRPLPGGGIEWAPGLDQELHTHFPEVVLGAKPGSRISVFGEIGFVGDKFVARGFDGLRLGLFRVEAPTRADGPLQLTHGEGFAVKFNPLAPVDKPGSAFRLRRASDPPTAGYVLGAAPWQDQDVVTLGFAAQLGPTYPFVLEVERRAANRAVARFLLNDRVVERELPFALSKVNTFAVGKTGSGLWKAVRLHGVGVRAFAAP